jgi:hypothetical protein
MTDITVTFEDQKGYVARLPNGITVAALSLAGLRARLPNARFVLDRRAQQERDQRRRGGHGGAQQWNRTR